MGYLICGVTFSRSRPLNGRYSTHLPPHGLSSPSKLLLWCKYALWAIKLGSEILVRHDSTVSPSQSGSCAYLLHQGSSELLATASVSSEERNCTEFLLRRAHLDLGTVLRANISSEAPSKAPNLDSASALWPFNRFEGPRWILIAWAARAFH